MFAGQGAQYFQMGRELYERDAVFRAAMDRCDAVAGPIEGRLISEIVYGRPMSDSTEFDRQLESTPALLAIGTSLAHALLARGVRPDLLLGYSFGETIAAVIAGVFTLEDAFRMVLAKSRLIEAQLAPGAMLAVLGGWEALRSLPAIAERCELAAVNSPRHFVVATRSEHAASVGEALERAGVAYARLPVRYGFHASLIDPAGPGLRAIVASVPRRAASLPIVSSMTTAAVARIDGDHLWNVSRRPIRFADTVRALAAAGPVRFIEAGPTGTLAIFVKQALGPDAVALPAINQFGQNLRTMAEIEALIR